MKIRFGKDIKIKWEVSINDRDITNSDNLTLILTNPRLQMQMLDFIIEDNSVVAYYRGKEHKYTGTYKLTLWYNYGKEGQSALDSTEAFTLVRFTDREDENELSEVELNGILSVGVQGESAYSTWLRLGNTGTEEDFIKSLKGEKGDKADLSVIEGNNNYKNF
jgi:hypothetical protein